MSNLMPIEIGTTITNGIEESTGFLNLFYKATAACSCGWRGKTYSRLNIFSSREFAQKLALLEYFLHEKKH